MFSYFHYSGYTQCLLYMLWERLDVCTNFGELNLLNTQNNLLKEPPVKCCWFHYGSSGLNCKLSSFSVELIQKIIFSMSEFDYIFGKIFIIINCCTSGTLVSGSLLFACTKWGKFRPYMDKISPKGTSSISSRDKGTLKANASNFWAI